MAAELSHDRKGVVRFLAFACLAASASAASRPPIFADLADRARAQPAEFAADALLRIADAPTPADVAWKREILEDAFHLAAGAQQPLGRRNWTGKPGSLFDKAYAQGLDACTLQCKAVHAMLAIDYKKARELFGEIPPPQIPRLTCEDALVYDVSIFYATVGEVAARAFSAKEVAQEEPFHLLQRYAADVTSPAQAAPIARMLVGASLKPAQFEALVDSFAGALVQLSGDDRSSSATIAGDADAAIAGLSAECARRRIDAQPLLEAWRAYLARQLSGARCADSVAQGVRLTLSGDGKAASVGGNAPPAGQWGATDRERGCEADKRGRQRAPGGPMRIAGMPAACRAVYQPGHGAEWLRLDPRAEGLERLGRQVAAIPGGAGRLDQIGR